MIEDGVKIGGVGEYIKTLLLSHDFRNVKTFGFADIFFAQGSRSEILDDAGLSARKILEKLT